MANCNSHNNWRGCPSPAAHRDVVAASNQKPWPWKMLDKQGKQLRSLISWRLIYDNEAPTRRRPMRHICVCVCVCLIPTVLCVYANITSFNDIFNLPRIELFAIGLQCARIMHGQWIAILCFLIAYLWDTDHIHFQIITVDAAAEGQQQAGETKNWLQHG